MFDQQIWMLGAKGMYQGEVLAPHIPNSSMPDHLWEGGREEGGREDSEGGRGGEGGM